MQQVFLQSRPDGVFGFSIPFPLALSFSQGKGLLSSRAARRRLVVLSPLCSFLFGFSS